MLLNLVAYSEVQEQLDTRGTIVDWESAIVEIQNCQLWKSKLVNCGNPSPRIRLSKPAAHVTARRAVQELWMKMTDTCCCCWCWFCWHTLVIMTIRWQLLLSMTARCDTCAKEQVPAITRKGSLTCLLLISSILTFGGRPPKAKTPIKVTDLENSSPCFLWCVEMFITD